MPSPIMIAIKQVCEEKGIKPEEVLSAVESALAAAYRKDFGTKTQNIKVEFNAETGGIRVFDVKTAVEDSLLEETVKLEETAEIEEVKQEAAAPEGETEEKKTEEKKKRFNPKTDIILSEALQVKADAKIGDQIITELAVPGGFGRVAAQTAKQVIVQGLREIERNTLYQEFKAKEGELIVGVVQRQEKGLILVDLGKATAILPYEEQIPRERYNPGQRMKFYLKRVELTNRGPEIVLSRASEEMVKKISALEIPEVASGRVIIKAVAREAGERTKMAVASTEKNIDPIGSCIGQRGSRIQTIILELGGEKIDVIEYNEDIERFIVNSLAPAKVARVILREEDKNATVFVKSDQLSLAIGRGGQNVRLASKLTGWNINIEPEKEEAKEETAESKEEVKEEKKAPEGEAQEEKKEEIEN